MRKKHHFTDQKVPIWFDKKENRPSPELRTYDEYIENGRTAELTGNGEGKANTLQYCRKLCHRIKR